MAELVVGEGAETARTKPCPFCREAIHDEAVKCRFCNEMLVGLKAGDQVVSVKPAPTAERSRRKRGFLATAGALVVGAVVVYLLLPRSTKDTVNNIASHSGVVGRAVPWVERADTALRTMLDGQSGAAVALSIQASTHPTGVNPRFVGYDVTRMGDRVAVRISVSWQGGITGDGYTTVVLWEFSESGHISTTLVSDSSVIPASRAGIRRLDDWFRASFYPTLYSNTGG